MKVRVYFVLLAALLGLSSLLEAQVVPDPLDNLRPWVNDSTPAYSGYREVGEWGTELGREDYGIVRNAEEN